MPVKVQPLELLGTPSFQPSPTLGRPFHHKQDEAPS